VKRPEKNPGGVAVHASEQMPVSTRGAKPESRQNGKQGTGWKQREAPGRKNSLKGERPRGSRFFLAEKHTNCSEHCPVWTRTAEVSAQVRKCLRKKAGAAGTGNSSQRTGSAKP